MGIIIDQKLYTGENGYAGEIGHTILIPNGKSCVCGNKGCLERYISDTALIEDYYTMTKKNISITELIIKIKSKEKSALKIYEAFIEYLSLTINYISQMLNPQTIIINSKLIEAFPESISLIKNKLRSKVMNLEILTTSKYKSKSNVLGLTHVLIRDFLEIDNHY